jgi:hypothetical protein
MKKIVRLSENELVHLVKKIINESDSQYYIYGEADHLQGKGMFIYTGDGSFSMVPKSISFRRTMEEHPEIFDSRKEAEKVLKMLRKNGRPDIRWYISIV